MRKESATCTDVSCGWIARAAGARVWALLMTWAASGLVGCDSPAGKEPFAWLKPKPKQIETYSDAGENTSANMSLLTRLTGTDNGLAIRKWMVEDDEARIASVLMRHAIGTGEVLHDTADKRLQRNGFRLLRVDAAELDTILRELGGATLDVTAWHGQVFDWRAVAAHGIGRSGQPLAIDGHVRSYPAGEMRLVMRSWIVPMERGPFVQFELVPQFHQPQRRDLNVLFGRETPPPIESYSSLAIEELLEAGSAYILTCAPPKSQWSAEPAGAERAASETGASAANPQAPAPVAPPLRRAGGGVGPADVVGPEAIAPQTIGQWMFSSDVGRPSRIMLVLLPRISEKLYPPEVSAP